MTEHTLQQGYAKVHEGLLKGTVEDDLRVFRGVPYAAPPIGERRWRAPAKPARWFGVRSADRLTGGALQADGRANWPTEDFELAAKMDSEDCLYLNIWTPAKTGQEKLPVLVWIHGGGMVAGTGMAPFFEGEQLAKQGFLVVTINYRLGLMGFFCHPQLSSETPQGTSGNYALLDMREALLWLHENVSTFGGDPDKITVAGQSGGSVGTSCMLMSPLTTGLCRSVILESGCPLLGGMMDPKPLSEMESEGLTFAEKLGGKTLQQLREMDGCDLIEASLAQHYTPNYCVDGYVLPDAPHKLLAEGKFNPMHILVGSTSEEFGSFGFFNDVHVTPQQFEDYVHSLYPTALAEKMIQHYPHSEPVSAFRSVLNILGDLMFLSPARLGEVCAKQGQPCYVYYKTRPDSGSRGERLGSTHSSELPYVFGRPGKCIINPDGMSEADQAFGKELMAYWVQFIKTGSMEGAAAAIAWPQCSEFLDYLDLGTQIHLPSEGEKDLLRRFDAMLRENGETGTDRYTDTTALGRTDLFRPM